MIDIISDFKWMIDIFKKKEKVSDYKQLIDEDFSGSGVG